MRRWLKFNTVGIAGAGVQLACLWFLARIAGVHYVVATMIAVEIALLHNFAWHEVWTWRGMPPEGRAARLLRFQLANGLVSIALNALFTWIFTQDAGLPLLSANIAAMLVTALFNFLLAALWVFQPLPSQRIRKTAV